MKLHKGPVAITKSWVPAGASPLHLHVIAGMANLKGIEMPIKRQSSSPASIRASGDLASLRFHRAVIRDKQTHYRHTYRMLHSYRDPVGVELRYTIWTRVKGCFPLRFPYKRRAQTWKLHGFFEPDRHAHSFEVRKVPSIRCIVFRRLCHRNMALRS